MRRGPPFSGVWAQRLLVSDEEFGEEAPGCSFVMRRTVYTSAAYCLGLSRRPVWRAIR
jgi:hypothetical protein